MGKRTILFFMVWNVVLTIILIFAFIFSVSNSNEIDECKIENDLQTELILINGAWIMVLNNETDYFWAELADLEENYDKMKSERIEQRFNKID